METYESAMERLVVMENKLVAAHASVDALRAQFSEVIAELQALNLELLAITQSFKRVTRVL